MDNDPNPGVTTPPVEPVGDQPTAPIAPNGSEPVTNPGSQDGQTVPFSRFQEVNNKAKEYEDKYNQSQQEIEQLRTQPAKTSDDDVDDDVVKMVQASAKKLGLVSQSELRSREMQIQVRQDVKDLESEYASSPVPYDHQKIVQYAKDNNIPINSKVSLRAIYRDMNYDRLAEIERQKAIEEAQNPPRMQGERPGSRGAQPPTESEVSGKSVKERNMSRIQMARQHLHS